MQVEEFLSKVSGSIPRKSPWFVRKSTTATGRSKKPQTGWRTPWLLRVSSEAIA